MSPSAIPLKTHHGVVVPMVTPLAPSGDLDEPAVLRIIEHLLAGGVHGIFVLGTNGEMPWLTRPEVGHSLVRIMVQQVGGQAKTYAGVAGERAVETAETWFALGVDTVVVRLPKQCTLDAAGQDRYFRDIADRVPGPVILYNMPPIADTSIPAHVIESLAPHPNVAGLKDSENDFDRLRSLVTGLGGRDDFSILTGVTALSTKAISLGADGMVPSAGNLVPRMCRDLFTAARSGDNAAAEHLQNKVDKISEIYRRQGDPKQSIAALKTAASALGLCGPTVAPELPILDDGQRQQIQSDMKQVGLV